MTAEQTTSDRLAAPAMLRPGPSPNRAMTAGPGNAVDENLRERLGEFRSLLVISLLMAESVSEDQILDLAASSAPGLGTWRIDGCCFTDGQWRPSIAGSAPSPPGLARKLAALGAVSSKGDLPGRRWAWAYPLRGVGGLLGHLIASCDQEPSAEQRFLIQVLAQQTGVAVSNARLHAKERATASELAATRTPRPHDTTPAPPTRKEKPPPPLPALPATNTALAETVTNLRRSMDI